MSNGAHEEEEYTVAEAADRLRGERPKEEAGPLARAILA